MNPMRITTLLCSTLLTVPAFCQLVINEMDYDQPGTDASEYLELKNTGDTPYPMAGVRIALVNGEGGNPVIYQTYSSNAWDDLAPGGYFVLCGSTSATPNCNGTLAAATNAIQNGSTDAIVLLSMPDSTVIDQLSYEGTLAGYAEGDGTEAADDNITPDRSIGRFPDGADTDDNNTDLIIMCSTPGIANVGDTTGCAVVTTVQEHREQPSLTVFSDPGNDLVWMQLGNATGNTTFEVYALDGSLIAVRTTARSSWAWSTGGRHGCMLLVRATTATGAATRRIVLP